jgi:predicted DNA-binding antitoxin AbrB/MazE fold protein
MTTIVRAIYESEGILRLLHPPKLSAGQEVEISVEVPSPESDPAFDLAALAIDGGPPDLAHEHDHYLYNTPRRNILHDR